MLTLEQFIACCDKREVKGANEVEQILLNLSEEDAVQVVAIYTYKVDDDDANDIHMAHMRRFDKNTFYAETYNSCITTVGQVSREREDLYSMHQNIYAWYCANL